MRSKGAKTNCLNWLSSNLKGETQPKTRQYSPEPESRSEYRCRSILESYTYFATARGASASL